MKTIKPLALCLLLACTFAVRANGDPVAVYSAITLSPTPVAIHVPEVKLVDEAVWFTPRERYMEVVVRYLLHNTSKRAFDNLPYGFPIDYVGSGEARWSWRDEYSESQQEVGWRDSYIQQVSFLLGGKPLPWQCSKDTVIVPAKEDEESVGHPVSRRWYYTYLSIPANSYVTLEVHYLVECNRYASLGNLVKNYLGCGNRSFGYMYFHYDFTPASYWGNGKADHFAVQLDAAEIRDVEIEGLPMKQQDSRWSYEARNYKLADAKPFSVNYYTNVLLHQPLDSIFNHRIPSDQYTVEVSGVDKKYPVANLSDLDPSTTTVLRPDRNDSIYITIRFKKPTSLEGMFLLNGYTKDAEAWANNARIDKLMVFSSSRAQVAVDDEGETHIFPGGENEMLFGERDWIVKYTQFRPMPAKYPGGKPQAFDWQTLIDNAMLLNLSIDPWNETYYNELRIVISAKEAGFKYDDLCVSEIIFVGK